MTTFPAILTDPGFGFDIAAGLYVSWVGEDGDVIILGHHDDDKVAAALAVFDDRFVGDPRRNTWAVLTDPPEHDCAAADTTSCGGCEDATTWWLRWDVDESTDGAFPVTWVIG